MILENETIYLKVDLQAAEMHELMFKPTQKQWIWTADPNFWPQRNPILFPIVGSTFDKKIRLGDRITEMGNHGFTRHAKFQLDHQDETTIQVSFSSNPSTLEVYPFEFTLKVIYRLFKDHLSLQYVIENHSNVEMPFSFGLHPAFLTTHNGEDGAIKVEFSSVEKQFPLSILSPNHPRQLLFTDAFFKEVPTLVLEGVKSSKVALIDHRDVLEMDVSGYRWLAFWKKPKANFICIEPWHGHDDFNHVTCDFKDREGTHILAPNRSYTTVLTLKPTTV